MTCKQVLALIDAVPIAEWRPAQLEAAERHGRDCSRCHDALADAREMGSALADRPEPALPQDLAATTMARIARLEDEQTVPVRDGSKSAEAAVGGNRRAWVWVLAGHAAGLGALAFLVLTGGSVPDVTSSRISGGMGSLVNTPQSAPVALVLATGLLLYVAGLFAPLRSRGRRPLGPTGQLRPR